MTSKEANPAASFCPNLGLVPPVILHYCPAYPAPLAVCTPLVFLLPSLAAALQLPLKAPWSFPGSLDSSPHLSPRL